MRLSSAAHTQQWQLLQHVLAADMVMILPAVQPCRLALQQCGSAPSFLVDSASCRTQTDATRATCDDSQDMASLHVGLVASVCVLQYAASTLSQQLCGLHAWPSHCYVHRLHVPGNLTTRGVVLVELILAMMSLGSCKQGVVHHNDLVCGRGVGGGRGGGRDSKLTAACSMAAPRWRWELMRILSFLALCIITNDIHTFQLMRYVQGKTFHGIMP